MTDKLPHDDLPLPSGIWYEPDRSRYRVRVRRKERIIHQTRHNVTDRGLEDAFRSLRVGRLKRRRIIEGEGTIGGGDADRAQALADGLF